MSVSYLLSNILAEQQFDDEDEKAKKKLKQKRAKKAASKAQPIGENTDNFGGFEENEVEEETPVKSSKADKLAEIEAKKKELRDERKKDRLEKKQADVEKLNEAIQRNINRTIMEGKGLYRKRPKKFRNPRIKHRVKYQKALTKRRRMVQEHKEGPQAKYSGELTGIRSNLIKSTKL